MHLSLFLHVFKCKVESVRSDFGLDFEGCVFLTINHVLYHYQQHQDVLCSDIFGRRKLVLTNQICRKTFMTPKNLSADCLCVGVNNFVYEFENGDECYL